MIDVPSLPFVMPSPRMTAGAAPLYDASATNATAYAFSSCARTPTPTSATSNNISGMDDFRHVFCSPPRQSFQLLLRGSEDPLLKDALELPPRRSARLTPPAATTTGKPPMKRTKRTVPVTTAFAATTLPPRAPTTTTTTRTSSSLQPQAPQQQAPQQKKRPKRKASYLARKEEKEALVAHMDELEQQLEALKYQAVVHSSSSFRAQTNARKRLTNSILADAIQQHQLAVAGLQAMLSTYSSAQAHSPIETTIRLGRDLATRRATLERLKTPKLLEAKRFIEERSCGLDLTKTFSEEERFETQSGDLCSLRFDIIPIRGASSVRAVFDAMLFYIRNIEITISETMGHITIREDDDVDDDVNISHVRLVTNIVDAQSLQTESNSVLFAEFFDHEPDGIDSQECCGLLAGDFVDADELYPYRPETRVRRDVSAMMTVTPLRVKRDASRASGDANGDDTELIVVLKRWSLARMHKPRVPVPTYVLEEIRDAYGRWSDELSKTMRAHVLNPSFHRSSSSSDGSSSSGSSRDEYASTPTVL